MEMQVNGDVADLTMLSLILQQIGNLTSDLEHLRASNKELEASNVEHQVHL